jgi:hypothetical protein
MSRRLLAAVALILVAALAAAPSRARAQATPAPSTPAPSGDYTPTPGPAPSLPPPKPAPDVPARHKLAISQFLAWQSGTVDRTLYGDQINVQLTDDMLNQGEQTLANLGALQSATFLGISRAHDTDIFVYKMACEHGSVNMDFALAPDGKITLIFFE